MPSEECYWDLGWQEVTSFQLVYDTVQQAKKGEMSKCLSQDFFDWPLSH